MARRSHADETVDQSDASSRRNSGFDAVVVNGIVRRIEYLFDDIRTEHGAYMEKVKSLRADIGEIFDEAKSKGIPRKELKAVIKTRDLARRIETIRADMESEQQESYDALRLALGDLADTPLGEAATRGARGGPDDYPRAAE